MANYLRMIIVLSLITLISGFALGALNEVTYEKAENNILRFKKIPAVAGIYQTIMGPLTADKKVKVQETLLAEKITVELTEGDPTLLFVIKKDGKPFAVTLEKFGQGFGGELGVMTGFRLDDGKLVGIGVTTMAETPGIGTRISEVIFTDQFKTLPDNAVLKVKKDGGIVDAVAGATISSRAVAYAVEQADSFYRTHQEKIKQAVNQ